MMMTPTDIRYLHDLLFFARRDGLARVIKCPECGEAIPEFGDGYAHRNFMEIHTVIDLRSDHALTPDPTIVIGCEGYHIMDEIGREKDHEFQEQFDIVRTDEG